MIRIFIFYLAATGAQVLFEMPSNGEISFDCDPKGSANLIYRSQDGTERILHPNLSYSTGTKLVNFLRIRLCDQYDTLVLDIPKILQDVIGERPDYYEDDDDVDIDVDA